MTENRPTRVTVEIPGLTPEYWQAMSHDQKRQFTDDACRRFRPDAVPDDGSIFNFAFRFPNIGGFDETKRL
jgi:hypothetical protein